MQCNSKCFEVSHIEVMVIINEVINLSKNNNFWREASCRYSFFSYVARRNSGAKPVFTLGEGPGRGIIGKIFPKFTSLGHKS